MFLMSILLYSTPLSKNFGLVAVLSGIDKESLGSIPGAGLSGELEGPIKLRISVVHNEGSAGIANETSRIQYRVGGPPEISKGLARGKVYG